MVPDFTLGSIRQPIVAAVYYVDSRLLLFLDVKLDGRDVPATLRALDRAVQRSGHEGPVQHGFYSESLHALYKDVIAQSLAIAVCAALAVVIAGLGIFALSAYAAARRTREIGVRRALGASRGDVLRLLLWEFARPVLIANVVAWPWQRTACCAGCAASPITSISSRGGSSRQALPRSPLRSPPSPLIACCWRARSPPRRCVTNSRAGATCSAMPSPPRSATSVATACTPRSGVFGLAIGLWGALLAGVQIHAQFTHSHFIAGYEDLYQIIGKLEMPDRPTRYMTVTHNRLARTTEAAIAADSRRRAAGE